MNMRRDCLLLEKNYLTVTALTRYIKRKIDSDPHLHEVLIKGEISNFNHHRRGHMYFTLKDDYTRISAVMFAGYNRYLNFTPEEGMSVFIKGQVSVYENFGQYQLYVHEMHPDGVGALYLAFEQLKKKLSKEGLFDVKHKLPLPKYPKNIGIVTSDTGAAIQDILSTFHKRYPRANLYILPAIVQGEYAPDSIVTMIEKANHFHIKLDLLIVGRGGGSIEDLQPFNEERVARAIFHSKIPIVSAVGHETDVTISDYVADLRAPTPTGAVMLSVPAQDELLKNIQHMKQNLLRFVTQVHKSEQERLKRLQSSHAFRYPEQLLQQKEQELDYKMERTERAFTHLIHEKEQKLKNVNIRLQVTSPREEIAQYKEKVATYDKQLLSSFKKLINERLNELNNAIDKLTLLSPLHTIQRGFALPYEKDGTIIRTSKQVQTNDAITVEIKDAYLSCKVKNVREKNHDK